MTHIGPFFDGLGALTLHPDGIQVAVGFDSGYICLWSLENQRLIGAVCHVAEYSHINDLAFSPDGTLLASASEDGSVRIWDVSTQRELMRLAPQRPNDDDPELVYWERFYPLTLTFSPDGALLACGQLGGGRIKVWDVHSGQERPPLRGHTASRMALPYPQLASPEELPDLPRPKHVVALTFSQDGQTLLSGSQDNTIRSWNLSTRENRVLVSPNTYSIDTLAMHPTERYFASGGQVMVGFGQQAPPTAVIHCWDLHKTEPHVSLILDEPFVKKLVFTPDGAFLISVDPWGRICWWDTATWKLDGKARSMAPFSSHLLVSSDNRYLLSSGGSRRGSLVEVWRMRES
ncbi:MAG: hypothetical protein AAGF95_27175 [Chloroflexota bacterium]